MSTPSRKKPESSAEHAADSTGSVVSRLGHPLFLALGLLALAFLFANVEIQIEGGAGWAANLPTWRIESHPLLNVFWGGKPLTGYHLWVFTFMAAAFHLPLVMLRTFSLKLECRVLGSVMVFWIVEDFLWFLLNPAFGLARFRPEFVPWHKVWMFNVPTDYLVFFTVGCLLIAYSFKPSRGKTGNAPDVNRRDEQ